MVHIDTLAVTDEDELQRMARSLENGILKVKNRQRVMMLQTELCYVQREMQVRHNRKAAHEAYITRVKQTRR
tara:strand:+ start:1537 stop:1752 length:216 start_codon:yes stop_codon:yes gene_type:complete